MQQTTANDCEPGGHTTGSEVELGTGRSAESRHLARLILLSFLATFIGSRVVAFLIMSRTIPDLYVYLGGTHIHHLNYGIFLLAGVAAYLLFRRPKNPMPAGVAYGIGLALTFDEFGMWLHLGGSYWQRASWDAIAVTAALLALAAFGPVLAQFRPRHWWSSGIILLVAITFFVMLARSFKHAERIVMPKLERIESTAPR